MKRISFGFTLIELMIVVAIIGILVAVGMPQYQNYVARTQVAEGLSLASGIKTAIAEYYSTHGTFPPGKVVATNHDVLGIAASTDLTGNYVWKIEVKSDGKSQVFFNTVANGAHSAIARKEFWLIPTDNEGSISWRCACSAKSDASCLGGGTPSNRQIDEKYLPSSCLLASNVFDGDTDDLLLDPTPDPDPVPWADAKTSDNACWDQDYAAGAGNGNGWVVGNTKITTWKSYAKDHGLATSKWGVPTVANPVAADVSNYLCE